MIGCVCIASGPSLTRDDVRTVRSWQGPGRFVIAVNNVYQLAPWADYLYAMDNEYWRVYGKYINEQFTGLKYSRFGNYGTIKIPTHHGNLSGAGAILLADYFGAQKIILLGYDCQLTGGKRHWHADHKKPLGNCDTLPQWEGHFQKLEIKADVVNCTRETALKAFRRGELENELYRFD